MDFDYFYNREAERFNFLKVPEILVDGEEFKGLSAEAIILYSMLLKRTGMSFKNNWIDKEGRVFIYFTVEEIMRRRNISKPTAIKTLDELDSKKGIRLIERVRLGLDGFTLSTQRIDSLEVAEQLKNLLENRIEIADVIQKEKITKPDLPFDLTTLQRERNKYFGYSAKQTLDYAQSLYEKKLITYPRTDSRCLTEDMITSTINHTLGKNDFDTGRIKTVFNSKKVTDHHAIIPTVSSLSEDISKLPESEAKVYRLISNKFHASVGYPLIENTTKIVAEFDGFEFTSSGKVIVDEGFTKYLNEYVKKKNEDIVLPDVKIGDSLDIKDKEIKEKYTQPAKHFTEDLLLKAMELAGNDALEKGVEVERKGLGTPATRAGIIENLIFKGFVERDKKNLIATQKGISLVTIVADTFKSEETTAKWEMELSDIAQGKSSKENFLEAIENEIKEVVSTYIKQYGTNFKVEKMP